MNTRTTSTVFSLIALTLSLLSPIQAHALTLEFVPSSTTLQVGATLRIDVMLRNFDPGITPVIGDFDIHFKFNPLFLHSTIAGLPTATVFGEKLGSPGHETTAAWGGVDQSVDDIIRIAEWSYLYATSLEALQTDTSFILGSLYFDAITQGVSEVSFSSASIGGAPVFSPGGAYYSPGLRIPVELGSTVLLTVTSVPEADTWAMLLAGSGLVGAAVRRRRG